MILKNLGTPGCMRKLLSLLFIICCIKTTAQQYNNEWIDFSKTYYKFKVAESGVYRIPQTVLNGVGLGNTPAQQFKLFRNGNEVSIYTSVNTGPLPGNGYIQFVGEPNDGQFDKALYRDIKSQHSAKWSLQTDTAVYFLTTSAGPNLRIADVPNNTAANVLPAEPYFMHTAGTYFREKINHGFAVVVGEYVYSSSYDKGEVWSTQDITPGNPRTDAQNNLFVYPSGPAATIKYGATGNALNTRSVRLTLNGTVIRESQMDYFNDTVTQASFPSGLISSNAASVRFTNTSGVSTDRMVISFYEITYPRQFNFGAANKFSFELPAKNSGYYLEISNFSHGAQAPVLYDLTSQQRYIGEVSANLVKFAIPPIAGTHKFMLMNEEPGNVKTVSALVSKTFTDYRVDGNQGNYLIISNQLLYSGVNGRNSVEEYRKYRNTSQGGNYRSVICDIDELVDQFAFGIKKHPLSIKNFLRFARTRFRNPPQFVFLIGRGVSYNEYRYNQHDPLSDRLNLVPSYGYPSSDNLLSSDDAQTATPLTPIGRLSVVNTTELDDYLEKIKEYETMQRTSPNTIQGRLWMKNILHLTGASDSYLGTVLCSYMDGYKHIVEDTLVGGKVTVLCKASTNAVEQLSNERITNLFQEGLSMVNYFGHSSSTTLEFNLDDPKNYNNQGKYPVFSVNGCNAGNFYTFDPQRFSFNETLSEKFVLAKQRGGIAFIASTHFGIVNYLNIYISNLYNDISTVKYGYTLGEINREALEKVVKVSGLSDFYARLHAEEITLHGDPAIRMNFQAQPDYVIEEPQVKISPAFISVAENKFDVAIKLYNLGKAVKDSISVEVKRQYPDGSFTTLYRSRIKGIYYSDSINLVIPVVATRDKGLNKLIVTVDADNSVTEVAESNNTITKDFFIYEDEAKPAFPYNYAIVNTPGQKLYASTANPFSNLKQYVMEIDTTELFNSPVKAVRNITSVGGLLEFDPGVAYRDSTVYFWRTSLVPAQGGDYRWSNASFIYLQGNNAGFNQSHYFQHLRSTTDRIKLDADLKWRFGDRLNNVFLRNSTFPTGSAFQADYINSVNGNNILGPGCNYNELIFQVLDPITFKPWKNEASGSTGLYNSMLGTCGSQRQYNFSYLLGNSTSRKNAMNFIDTIPNGSYVIVRTNTHPVDSANTFSRVWKSDTALNGAGKSLYHKLFDQGFTTLDSFNRARAFVFMFKKNASNEFQSKTFFTEGIYDRIGVPVDCTTPDTLGFITSPPFGPAKTWKQLHWRGFSEEQNSADQPTIDIIGIDPSGIETKLRTIDKTMQDHDISGISAIAYPYLKLQMRNIDSVTLTPYQLRYWRLDYEPIPEGALTPNLFFTTKDTLDIGEKLNFGISFKNISQAAFDSLRIKVVIIDKDNTPHPIALPRKKPLLSGDTLRLTFEIDTKDYPGLNTLFADFNPDNDQPEQYHYNNFIYRNFYVKPDKVNPLMDVTFDGVHILNRDIVSAKPRIQIKLKDEAKFMLLNDTSLLSVQVRLPDQNGTLRTYQFDNDTLRFIPAQSGTDNTATIEFTPYFQQQYNPDGDDYELIVKGRDKSGNRAGQIEYRVTFRIINKPMISNLLNYPNPFTTSTAFVFTITGSEIPQQMKIQILTVTGKIVREITQEELGAVHIGRNITDFKWDGTDQFGQRLANGVYLYRVVTTLNGMTMDKYKAEGDATDQYFNRGYGKMYLMR